MTIENRKAWYDYEILEEYEAGLKLESWEVKAIASNICSIAGAHCIVKDEKVFLVGANIGSSEFEMDRTRELLLHKKEISRLSGKIKEKGLTVIPLDIHEIRGKFKLNIGIARGKKEYDKREADKKRSIEDDNRRTVKSQKFS